MSSYPGRLLGPLTMLTTIERIGRFPRSLILMLATTLALVVAVLDYVAGPHLSLRLFFLIPTVLVAWSIGKLAGWVFAAAGAAIDTVIRLVNSPGHVVPTVAEGLLAGVVLVAMATFVTETSRLLRFEHENARRDSLTDLFNRRAFLERADVEFARVRRDRAPLSLIVMDIDEFKALNDKRGHETGDGALRSLAAAIVGAVRVTDVVARLGGDEFVVLCPFATERDTVAIARRINLQFIKKGTGLSISMGIAASPPGPIEIDALLEASDRLMYEAKRLGKGIVSTTLEPR